MAENRQRLPGSWPPSAGSLSVPHAIDFALLGLVPVALVAVFTLPLNYREQLLFAVSDPTLLTAYTAPFVHLSYEHLLGNLLLYALAVPTGYVLSVSGGRRQLYRWAFVTFLVAFPLALAGLQFVFPRERILFGFSGLNSALVGLLCFMVVSHTSTHLSCTLQERDAPALLFFTIALITVLSIPTWAWMREIALVSAGSGLLYVGSLLAEMGVPTWSSVVDGWGDGNFELAVIGLGVLFVFPFLAFYRTSAGNAAIFDLYGHLLGYCLGFLIVYVFAVMVSPRVS
ncbi:rhomboid family intramembrane serine protease [Halorhabdus sp. CBA1104]|uniref:rhomboid family intramembrane serine protease n=1 Tax=Halorhabdus sp. CBA1104 TaxID=1380432 RepID=UPI0012B281B5|nr:rhomboid family intramembrane serine protease [Halorhabdus sp. CBA1104]QGN07445.1 rhomboid family intramembrane serine protease [Halorhabdus sp. CBA1104]